MDIRDFSLIVEHQGRPPASHLDLVAVAQHADDLGFHSIGLPYVPLLADDDPEAAARFGGVGSYPFPYHLDAHAVVPILLHETRRIKVGFQVLLAPVVHPFIWAKYLASLDVMSGGRAFAGFGIGVSRPIGQPGGTVPGLHKLGIPTRVRGKMSDEALEIMTRLWSSEEPFTFEGAHFTVRDVALDPRPLRRPGVELWWAGQSPRGFARAARFADRVELEWPAASFVREVAVPGMRAANAEHGGRADISALISLEVLEGRVPDSYVAARYGRFDQDSVAVGPAVDCAARIRALHDAGVDHFVLGMNAMGADPVQRLHEQMELFTARVLPLLA